MICDAFNTIGFDVRWRGICDTGLKTVGAGRCQEPLKYLACILLTMTGPDGMFDPSRCS